MVVTIGINSGFVVTAPTSDPDGGSSARIDGAAMATQDTSPATAVLITEIGAYINNATQDKPMYLGIYDTDAGKPKNQIGRTTLSKGAGVGWKVASGLSIVITPNT